MPGHSMPATGPVEAFMSSSLQISPGLSKYNPRRPKNGQKLNSSQIWYSLFLLLSYIIEHNWFLHWVHGMCNFQGMRIFIWARVPSSTTGSGDKSADRKKIQANTRFTSICRMLSQSIVVRILFCYLFIVVRFRLTLLYSTWKWSLERDSLRQSSFVYLGVAAWHRGILVLVTVIYDEYFVCIYKALRIVFRYLDDELILGIDGSSLEKLTGAMIPTVS
jgi:hypothetical protein